MEERARVRMDHQRQRPVFPCGPYNVDTAKARSTIPRGGPSELPFAGRNPLAPPYCPLALHSAATTGSQGDPATSGTGPLPPEHRQDKANAQSR